MIRRVCTLAIAIAAAAVVHAIAGHRLAAVDPIGRLVAGGDAAVVIAACATAVTRVFLFFVAPGWAAHVVGGALVRRAGYVPPK
jgi:hypothetical protein